MNDQKAEHADKIEIQALNVRAKGSEADLAEAEFVGGHWLEEGDPAECDRGQAWQCGKHDLMGTSVPRGASVAESVSRRFGAGRWSASSD